MRSPVRHSVHRPSTALRAREPSALNAGRKLHINGKIKRREFRQTPERAALRTRWTSRAALLYNPASAGTRAGSAQVAQLVEHATENRSVGGSIPPLGTTCHRILLTSAARLPGKARGPVSRLRRSVFRAWAWSSLF